MTIEEEARTLADQASALGSGGYVGFTVSENLRGQESQIIERAKQILPEDREHRIEFSYADGSIQIDRA